VEIVTQYGTDRNPSRNRLVVSVWLWFVLGAAACDCGGSGSDGRSADDMLAPRDAEALGDGDAPDGPSGPPSECTPSGTPSTLSCPAGCVEWRVRVVDVSTECATSEEIVGACFPEDTAVFGNGEATCFTHPAMDGLVIWSPSSVVGVAGGSDDILDDAGWVPCSETNKVRYEGFCE